MAEPIEDEWSILETNAFWQEEFWDCLGPEYFMWKDKADIERLIEELIGGEH